MKYKTLHNPEVVKTKDEIFTSRSTEPKIREVESPGLDIVNYRIEEAKLDDNKEIIVTNKPPFYQVTGRSLEWTIRKGETLEFPEYVANYLLKIYPFLQEVGSATSGLNVVEEPVMAKAVTGHVSCKFCGMNFKNEKSLALHMAHKHMDKIL